MMVLPLTQQPQLALYRTHCLTDILLREHVLLCVSTPHTNINTSYLFMSILKYCIGKGRWEGQNLK